MMQLFYQFENGQLYPYNFFWIFIWMIQNFDLLQAQTSSLHSCTKLLLRQSHDRASEFLRLLWKTGYYSTSVYQDVRFKYFDSNFSIPIIWFDSGIDPWSRIVSKVQWWSMITKWKLLFMLKFPSWLAAASRFWNTICMLTVTIVMPQFVIAALICNKVCPNL